MFAVLAFAFGTLHLPATRPLWRKSSIRPYMESVATSAEGRRSPPVPPPGACALRFSVLHLVSQEVIMRKLFPFDTSGAFCALAQ